ncbi:MAG TPA: threonine aldolase family protein, partial [Gemmatimonadaceae bacterium]|nr:threonine aldolase family protein [Gemmatimonadaceae bacterium]
ETVNLWSDTQTRPSAGMRQAMAEAEVGDEQRMLDPTVNALQERVAELLGHEAALFLPSGTMCNQIAIRLHTRPGDEVILERFSHPIIAESGGPAAHSGVMMQPIDGEGGMFTADQVRASLRTPGSRYEPRSRLLCVEQTTNYGGGRVWPLDQMRGVLGAAKESGILTHLDGARLMNAVVASGVSAADYASEFDTAWIDFTKGLGAPVGACLAGSRAVIHEAWRYKQMMGGALRQAGIVAAAGMYALDHNVERLAEDHANARTLAEGIAAIDGARIDPSTVETNIVIFEVDDPARVFGGLFERGVEMTPMGPGRIRAVTHLDVDAEGIQRALAALEEVLAAA